MMRLRNIPRAGEILKQSSFVIKNETVYKGRWSSEIFKNNNPIHLEIGMGKGQFLLTLAQQHPSVNYIGIERYSSVLLRAIEKLSPPLSDTSYTVPRNLRFICMDASAINTVFAPQEIDRIYLNFSDPWPKARHAGRRLTSPEYLDRYERILQTGGQIEFKTDNQSLFDFSVETLNSSNRWEITALTCDLHHDSSMNSGNIMTEYEEKFSSMNNPIYKLIAKRQSDSPFCIY